MDLNLKDVNKIIGKSFKDIRKSKKYTQEEIAEKCNVTPEYLSKFENGKYNASIYNIILLCRAIHISPMQLLHSFFDDTNETVISNLLDELKTLQLEDQKLLLEFVKRLKKGTN